jgi:hypothetical protein
MMILSHLLAALSGFLTSIRYFGVLGISRGERVRYLKKSIRLALCYAGFANPWSAREAWKAGEAALLSCAYDVVTDWRNFHSEGRIAFANILSDLSQGELRELALTLYDKDLMNQVSVDGLERGAIALRFILKTMECEKQREAMWGDLTDLGELLQIVDDVLDYEDDTTVGDQNCLITAKRDVYIRRLLDGLSSEKCRRLFGSASVLALAIAHARTKAITLLSNDSRG